VTAVDVLRDNLALAERLGAGSSVPSTPETTGSDIVRAGRGAMAAVIDSVNNSATSTAAFDALRKGGRLVQVGLFGGELTVPTALMALKTITIEGSFVGSLGELRHVVDLAKQGLLPRVPTIDAPLTSASVKSSLDRLVDGGVPGRIVLTAEANRRGNGQPVGSGRLRRGEQLLGRGRARRPGQAASVVPARHPQLDLIRAVGDRQKPRIRIGDMSWNVSSARSCSSGALEAST
jgi:hypothetical protein